MIIRFMLPAVVTLCSGHVPVSAEALQQRYDAEGNVHFGTSVNPYLCCMCQTALDYEVGGNQTRFILPYGLERKVGNDRVFLSSDSKAWYCEGSQEMGRAGQKCGLVPPVM